MNKQCIDGAELVECLFKVGGSIPSTTENRYGGTHLSSQQGHLEFMTSLGYTEALSQRPITNNQKPQGWTAFESFLDLE